MSENKVPMRTVEHKVEELTGGWRKLDNVNVHNLYSLHGYIQKLNQGRCSGEVMQHTQEVEVYIYIYISCELESLKIRKKQLARHRCKCKDTIKIALEEILYDVKGIQSIQDSVK